MSFRAIDSPPRRRVLFLRAAAAIIPTLFLVLPAEAALSLGEAQARAVARSRQLSAQDAAMAASRELAVAAGQLPDPVFKLGLDNLPVEGSDRFSVARDFMTQRRVGFSQELTRADKRELRAERYRLDAEKTLADKTAAVAAIERDTALAWLDRSYAEAMAAAFAGSLAQSRMEAVAAESAWRGGRGSEADLFAARGAVALLEDRASEYGRRVATARIALQRWTGGADDEPLAAPPAFDTVRVDGETLDDQLVHHPDIAALFRLEEIAATDAKLAQANRRADWTVDVSYSQRGPAYSNMVSIGVSVPLQWDTAQRQDRETGAKLAVVEQLRAQREEALRMHVADVRTLLAEWRSGRERLARYDATILPLAHERTAAALAGYRGAKATLADALAAQRNEIETHVQRLQLALDTARLWAQLNFLYPDEAGAAGAHLPGRAMAPAKESQ